MFRRISIAMWLGMGGIVLHYGCADRTACGPGLVKVEGVCLIATNADVDADTTPTGDGTQKNGNTDSGNQSGSPNPEPEVDLCDPECVLFADPGSTKSQFGSVLANTEQWLAVSAKAEAGEGTNRGAVYLFKKDLDGLYQQMQRVSADDGVDGDYFGNDISLHPDWLAVGTPFRDGARGAVYLYHRNEDTFEYHSTLTIAGAAAFHRFGINLAFSQDQLIIGAIGENTIGAIYVFALDNDVWTQQQRLVPPNLVVPNVFGTPIAADDDTVVVGSILSNSYAGGAFVYQRNSEGNFIEKARLTADDAAANDTFGWALSVSGNHIAVAAVNDDDNGTDTGSVYLFEGDQSGWHQRQKFSGLPTDAGKFGYALHVSGNRLVVGSQTNVGTNPKTGMAHVFDFDEEDALWTRRERFVRIQNGQGFADALKVDGDRLIVGARWDSEAGDNFGSVFILHP